MKNGKWQFVVGTSDFYLSLFICHLSLVILGRLRGRKKFVQFVEFVASLSAVDSFQTAA